MISLASNEIFLLNEIGYGLNNLKNINNKIKDIEVSCKKIKLKVEEIKNYKIKTRFETLNCSTKRGIYTINVSYSTEKKRLNKSVEVNTTSLNEKINNQLNDCIKQILDLLIEFEKTYDKAINKLKISIEEFRKLDSERAKIIDDEIARLKNINFKGLKDELKNIKEEDIAAIYSFNINNLSDEEKAKLKEIIDKMKVDDIMANIHVACDGNGNYMIVKTRRLKPESLESIIKEDFKSVVGDRKYKIDYLHDVDGYSIVLENGDILTKEGQTIRLEDGIIFKSIDNRVLGSSTKYGKVGESGISYFSLFGIPVGVSGDVTCYKGKLNIIPGKFMPNESDVNATADLNLFKGGGGLRKEEKYSANIHTVKYKFGADISLIGGSAGIGTNDVNISGKNNGNDILPSLKTNLEAKFNLGIGANLSAGYGTDVDGKVSSISIGADAKCILGIKVDFNLKLGKVSKYVVNEVISLFN